MSNSQSPARLAPLSSLSSSDSVSHLPATAYPLVVHSHLRWDWVWQRPQQFLSRLSKRHRILFVEAPLLSDKIDTPHARLRTLPDFPNITIMQTEFPAAEWGGEFSAWVDVERRRLLHEVLAGPLKNKFDNAVQWFYDPMAVTAFAGKMNERAIVYDCMDELSQFKGAPAELVARERDLLAAADVVFAGGRKMHESKSRYNSNCHFYGCGVDVAHFGLARRPDMAFPGDVPQDGNPILGYFGVVDERIDYDLLAKLADANPNWHVVIVGPVTKVDPAMLPQRSNLHWLGGKDYLQLPAYTKSFDVCLMPFARNEATEYINPTKALEYMATATPIVSSDVPDVVSNFHSVVKIATSHDEFVQMCREALDTPDHSAVERGIKMANGNTWDAIVACLEAHIADVLTARSTLPTIPNMSQRLSTASSSAASSAA